MVWRGVGVRQAPHTGDILRGRTLKQRSQAGSQQPGSPQPAPRSAPWGCAAAKDRPILKFTRRDRRLRIAKAVIEGKEHIHTTSLQAVCKVAIIRSVVGLRRWASGLRLCMSTSGGMGLTPGQGTKIPHALWQSQKQQKKYC